MTYIKLYHTIWPLSLSPNAFRTYCALLRFMNTCTCYANVSMRKLAAVVGISEKSISRGVRELQEKKLLTIVEKHYNGHRLANGYRITQQTGGYTKLRVEALTAPVSASGFMTYVYILKCADTKKRAFPSLRSISKAIDVTVQTVITQIKELVKHKLLNKFHQIKKNRSFGHNLYHLLDRIGNFIKRGRTRLARVSYQVAETATSNCKFSVRLENIFVKGFSIFSSFFKGGAQILSEHVLNPFLSLLKKIKTRLLG